MITERRVTFALLAALGGLLVWNAAHYPWRQGYDATAAAHYAETLGRDLRLPDEGDTDVWHNPPLWFALAGAVYRAGELIGVSDPGFPVQLLSAVFVLGIVALTGRLARDLLPDRRAVPLLAVVAALLTPVLVRAGILFHPEPLAALLVTGALAMFVRTLRRRSYTIQAGLAVGALVGLANLTRTWALAALAALLVGVVANALREHRPAATRFALGVAIASLAVVGPWLAVKTVVHGSPVAYSQPNPDQWRQTGRPASFWYALHVRDVADAPYQPQFRNVLLPTIYSDWWGDYWRVYRVPPALKDEPDRLPARYATPLRRQVAVGLAGTLLALVGLVVLVRRAFRDRDLALGTVLLAATLLGASFAAFLGRYPKQDGDNIKALYLLNAAPLVALAVAVGADTVGRRGWPFRVALLAVGAIAAITTLSFLTLS